MTGAEKAWTHTYKVTLSAPPARVFAALTDPSELRRWFAESVEIDPRPGGLYRFWGKHTYGIRDRTQAAQRITRLEAGRTLSFEWPIGDVRSEVTLDLSKDDKKDVRSDEKRREAKGDETGTGAAASTTILSLRHEFAAGIDVPHGAELIDDLWRMTLGNLDAHLRGGDGIVLPDFTDDAPEIRLSILIDASRPRVFRALTDPAALNRWIASAAEVEPRVGGRYSFGWKYKMGDRNVEGGPTKILELVPDERIVTDWPDWRGDETRPPTRVAWLLEDAGAGTKVTLVHSGFSRVADKSDYPFGWREFMDQLKREAETQPPNG
jgi:uncharacterized protein YndB with AHSA1/START domain